MFRTSTRGFALLISFTTALGGCTLFETEVNKEYAEKGTWLASEPRAYTTADVRMIAQRDHPVTHQTVVCTEPSPDVAKALATAAQLSLQGGSNAGASGQVGLSGGTAEAVAELAGRSTALIALRDGLYRACEAYANGAIGSDAYALVLSRYGQLMTTLFLGEDIRGAAAGGAASVQSPTLININPSGSGSQTQGTPSTAPADKTKAAPAATKSSWWDSLDTGLMEVANRATPAPATKPATPTTTPAAPPTTAQGQGNQASPSSASGTSGVAAVALVRMEEDFRDLDANFLNQLVVACVNEYDLTRKRTPVDVGGAGTVQSQPLSSLPSPMALPPQFIAQNPMAALLAGLPDSPGMPSTVPGQNAWLRQICPSLASVKILFAAQDALLQSFSVTGHPAANVRPDAGLTAPANNSQGGK